MAVFHSGALERLRSQGDDMFLPRCRFSTLPRPSKVSQVNAIVADVLRINDPKLIRVLREAFVLHERNLNDVLLEIQQREKYLAEALKHRYIPSSWNSNTLVKHCTNEMYSVVESACPTGGNGSGGAIYGEMSKGSMQRIIDHMKEHLDFTKDSKFLDIGSGVGKPSFHVSQDPGVSLSMGIELKKERWYLSQHALLTLLQNNEKKELLDENLARCWFVHGDVTLEDSLSPFTHVYSFDIGWLDEEYRHVGILFNESPTCMYYICYKTPKQMEHYGFKVKLLHKMTGMSQHGSGSKAYPCYFYKKTTNASRKRKGESRFEKIEAFLQSNCLETKMTELKEEILEANNEMYEPRKKKLPMCYRCNIASSKCQCLLKKKKAKQSSKTKRLNKKKKNALKA